ncbi:hypothetical protein [Arcanobacterium ihumii]|uniref:hypothetical protein n=1 Tax=Arcanobacterium ihumii TaxID=2138162 RepID=UPI000F52C370|nr:hypothetical protein [Arcanobacterium ihumii]
MSETPRLSRKELRELGKLATRESDSPSLTETAELRLRRPSRKELREAERSNATAEHAIMQGFSSRQNAESTAENTEDGAEKSPKSHVSKHSHGSPAHNEAESIARHEDIPRAEAESIAIPQKKLDSVLAAEAGSTKSRATEKRELEPTVVDDATSKKETEVVSTEPDRSTSDQPIRTSVFNRFDNDDEPKRPRSLRERLLERTRRDNDLAQSDEVPATGNADVAQPKETPEINSESKPDDFVIPAFVSPIEATPISETPAEERSVAKVETVEKVDAKADLPTQLPVKDESEAKANEDPANGAAKQEKESVAGSDSIVAPSESQKAVETAASEEESLVYEESGKRNWIGLLLLIAIGALVGYLLGSWVSTFLADSTSVTPVANLATVFQI